MVCSRPSKKTVKSTKTSSLTFSSTRSAVKLVLTSTLMRKSYVFRVELSLIRASDSDDNNARRTVRLLYVVVSLLLQNAWRYLHYEYAATAHQDRHRLWWWPYKEFVNIVRRVVGSAQRTARAAPRTGHPTTGSTGNHNPRTPLREWLRCRVGG